MMKPSKYIFFGSENSIDTDLMVIVDELLPLNEMRDYAKKEYPNVDVNFCVIKDGIVVETYKGTPDEVNNSIYYTYDLHNQDFENPIKHIVSQNVNVKLDRVLRGLLSMISRSQYRKIIKPALKTGIEGKLKCLEYILTDCYKKELMYETLVNARYGSVLDFRKFIVFQLGQVLSLMEDNSFGIFTKRAVVNYFLKLNMNVTPYIDRIDVYEYNFQFTKAKCFSNVNSINYIINYFIKKCFVYLK